MGVPFGGCGVARCGTKVCHVVEGTAVFGKNRGWEGSFCVLFMGLAQGLHRKGVVREVHSQEVISMDLNKMTEKVREALGLAQQEGIRRRQQTIEPEHVLWAMLSQEHGLAEGLLTKCAVSAEMARTKCEEALDRLQREP